MQWFGIWGAHAPTFLLVLVISTTLLFALPIFLVPLHWARLFQWKIPAETDLAVYFGRCLGAFILMFEFMAWRGAHGHDPAVAFTLLLWIAASMTLVHIYGALRRIQPWTETLEIGFYSGLFCLAWLFFPTPG
ncbi:MAG TPA: hypothetical protein VIR56_02940 [Solimonas sp.]